MKGLMKVGVLGLMLGFVIAGVHKSAVAAGPTKCERICIMDATDWEGFIACLNACPAP